MIGLCYLIPTAVEVVDHTRPIQPLVKIIVDNDSTSQIHRKYFGKWHRRLREITFLLNHNIASQNGDDTKGLVNAGCRASPIEVCYWESKANRDRGNF